MPDGDLSRTLKEFASRFWAKRRAAFSGGRGYYWLSMLLLAVSLLCVRAFFLPAQKSARQTQLLLREQQEPSSNNHFPAVSAALIGTNADWTICEEELTAKEDPGRGGKLPDQLFTLFMTHYFSGDGGPREDLRKAPRFADLKRLAGADERWTKSVPLDVPERLVPDSELHTAPGMEQALKSQRQESALRVPSQLSRIILSGPERQLGLGQRPSDLEDGVQARVTDAIQRSRNLEALHPFVGKPAVLGKDAPDDPGPIFESFYFISVDGAVRTLEPIHSNLVAHRVFHGASIIQEGFLQTQPQECTSRAYQEVRYHSRPYLDLNGDGLIVTLCYRVQPPGEPSGNTVGVFCADISLPRSRIEKSLQDSELFDTVLVELRTHTPPPGMERHAVRAELEALRVCGQEGFDDCPKFLRARNDETFGKAVATAQQWWHRVSQRGSYYGAADLVVSDDGTIAAAIFREALTRSEDRYELAILIPTTGSGWWGYLALAVLCVMLISTMFVRAAIQQDRQKEAGLLRGLPFGVVRIDEGSHIVAANDRAEELLNRPLPKFGLSDPTSPRNAETAYLVTDILCSDRVYFRRGGGITEGKIEDLWERRKRGLTEEYWVKLDTNTGAEERGAWFRVIGSPILRTPGKMHAFIMFERADPRALPELLREAESRKR